ncbi:MAG: hypothetical protein Ct9H300mP8_11390 [Gammaproteobacteria bacterium]|nr:MAG: hypothetical protein Ct9H300mP8_11390 [Gammaproteobacteria bacterium]
MIEATGLSLSFRFAEGRARVLASTDPGLGSEGCGSLQRIFEIMLGKQAGGVSLEGDLTLLEDFRRVFKPALEAQQLTDQMRSAAELGVGAMRSAVDGVANEVARRTNPCWQPNRNRPTQDFDRRINVDRSGVTKTSRRGRKRLIPFRRGYRFWQLCCGFAWIRSPARYK